MSVDPHPVKLWFLDWFGHILDYDQETRQLQRIPLNVKVPDLFILAYRPLRLPSHIQFRQNTSLPSSLPRIEMLDAEDNFVAFHSMENRNYLTINPRNNVADFAGHALNDWERFLPLTEEDVKALSLLTSAEISEIKNSEGESVSPLTLGEVAENIGNLGKIGAFQFPLAENLKSLSSVGNLKAGESQKITLSSNHGEKKTFTVTHKEP